MSEDTISELLAKTPAERGTYLISLFLAAEDSSVRADLITIMGYLGDVQSVGDFYIAVLKGNDNRLKFRAAFEGRLPRFGEHTRLQESIANHLRGATSGLEAWLRDAAAEGMCKIRVKKGSSDG